MPVMILVISVVFFLMSCVISSPKIDFPTPANNSRIFSTTVTLFWDHLNAFESFEIWFGNSPEDLQEVASVTVNHYTIEGLEWGKTYYWKIIGYKTEKNSVESSLWQFAVGNPHQGLLLGITDYDGASDLNLTDDDALNMKTAFEATIFDYQIDTLLGRVVKTDIINILENVQESNEEGVFTFFYAGHGGYANNESYLYLSDGYRLYMSELRLLLQQLPGKKLVIIDACQSGNFTQLLPGRDPQQLARIENELFNASVLKAFSADTRNGEPEFYVMTGANIYQSSWENNKLQNGVFSFFLLDGIGDVGIDNPTQLFDFTFDADVNSDGLVTMSEAYTYAAPKVEQYVHDLNGYHQSIQVFPQGSDFVISQW